MRLSTTLIALLFGSFLFAQIPSVNYYGESPVGKNTIDFISLNEGAYSVFGNGYYAGHSDLDICVVSFYEVGGPIALSTFTEEKNQTALFVEPLPDGHYVVCSSTIIADQIFNDIKLTLYNSDGMEVNAVLLASPYADAVLRYKVDEIGNIYLLARLGSDAHNVNINPIVLMKYDAELTEIYSLEQEIILGAITSISTLPEGQLVVFSSDYMGNISGSLLADNGETIWERVYDSELSNNLEWAISLFDGTNIKLLMPSIASIWTIDVSDGEQINEEDLPVGLPYISFGTRFLQHDDSYWLVYSNMISKVSRDEFDLLVLEEEYTIPSFGISKLHPDRENTIMLLTFSGSLIRFDFESGLFTTIETLPDNIVYLSERVDRLSPTSEGLVLGLTHNAGFNEKFSLVKTTATGELIEKIIVDPEGVTSSYEILSVANDKASLLSTDVKGAGLVSFWNMDGSLRSTLALNNTTETFISAVDGVSLDDGRLIGICFYENPQTIHLYDIDHTNETAVELGSFLPQFSMFSGFIHAIDGDNIGFIERPFSSSFKAIKVNTSGEIIWENAYEIGEDRSRSFITYSEWVVNPAADTYLLGSVVRGGGILPSYDMKVLDTDGNLINEFQSDNSFIDATPIFNNDNEIIVIGTDYNLDNQTDGEQFQLYYQRYDLEGNLLYERIHELPYQMYFHQLEFLPNQNLALMGRATIDANIDAVLIIMDEEGAITNISTLAPDWGELELGPNPGIDYLKLQLENEYQGPLQIKLLDSKGQQLRTWSANKLVDSWTWQQTFSDIPAGTYWLNISSPAGQITKAWIKQ